jgi:Cdc6-like AAA superfamily ATPase
MNTQNYTYTDKNFAQKLLEYNFQEIKNLHIRSPILVTEEILSEIKEEQVKKNYSIINRLIKKLWKQLPSQ